MDDVARLKPIFRDAFNFLTEGVAKIGALAEEAYWSAAAEGYERLCLKHAGEPLAADLMVAVYEELERIAKRAKDEKRSVHGRDGGRA